MAKTLLAVHAHPDDETITMGGTLARYSAEGVRTIVVTKRAALACHKSQMPADHFLMRMPDTLADKLWAYEFFSREDHGEVFENPETDLFAGLGQANSCSGRISQN
jgi:LmbE family N-acetylglucosaminyl deacetylase